MDRVLYVVGDMRGWAITNRAKNLRSVLSPCLQTDITTYGQLPQDLKAYRLVHVQTLSALPLREPWRSHARWGFELVSERSWAKRTHPTQDIAGACFCVVKNPELKRHVKGHVKGPVYYIPNGVDTTVFRPRTFIVGWCGKKSPRGLKYKGVQLIRKACAAINEQSPYGIAVQFLMDPSSYPKKLLGPREMSDFYRCVDVYVQASQAEGCSNVTLKALATGLPVVTTQTGIWRALNKAGVLHLAERSVEGLAAGILQALAPALRARKLMCEQYTWKHIADQYRKLYRELGVSC